MFSEQMQQTNKPAVPGLSKTAVSSSAADVMAVINSVVVETSQLCPCYPGRDESLDRTQ